MTLTTHELYSRAYMGDTIEGPKGKKWSWLKLKTMAAKAYTVESVKGESVTHIKVIGVAEETFTKVIDTCAVEAVKNDKGMWAYRIKAPKVTGYATSPGVIESGYKFDYAGAAFNAAGKMVDLYHRAGTND